MKTVDILFSSSLNSTIGPTGTLRRINKNREYFLSCGYNITIFTPDNLLNNKHSTFNSINRLKKYSPNLKIKLRKSIKNLLPKSFILSSLYQYKQYVGIKKITKKYILLKRSPDIMVFHDYIQCYQFNKMCNNNNKSKIVCFLHSDGRPFYMRLENFPKLKNTLVERQMWKIHNYLLKKIDKYVFIAKMGARNFIELHPNFDKNKVAIIINGIEDYTTNELATIDSLQMLNNFKYRFVCTGTIQKRKGQFIILKALCEIRKDILEKIHITFIGDGPNKIMLEEFVKNNNLSKNVSFIGKIENSNVYKYLANSNIFILMSYNEGLPISIIEAMRAGLPIITTNRSGMPELVKNNFNGLLLEPNINQLKNVLNDIEKYDWQNMSKNSRIRFENEFIFDRMKKEYCGMLNSITNSSRL